MSVLDTGLTIQTRSGASLQNQMDAGNQLPESAAARPSLGTATRDIANQIYHVIYLHHSCVFR